MRTGKINLLSRTTLRNSSLTNNSCSDRPISQLVFKVLFLFLVALIFACKPVSADAPTHTTPGIVSSSGNNYTTNNITCYNQSTSDIDGDNVTNIYNWYIDGTSIMILNMPFDTNTTSTSAGAVRDYSPYQNNGTISDIESWNKGSDCIRGGCYFFDGVNDDIDLGSDASIRAIVNGTISLWFKPLPGDGEWLINNFYDVNDAWGITANESFISIYDDIGASASEYFATTIETSVWHHAVATFNTGGGSLYVDGILVGNQSSVDWSWDGINSGSNIYVGQRGDDSPTRFYNGTIDELIIYNKTLSPEQIYQLFLEGNNSHTNSTIVSNETSAGEIWTCEVIPNDATSDGTALNSSITIKNLPWADSSLDRCVNITITNPGSSTLTNFPAFINITYDNDMQADFDDIRFYNDACNNGGGQLDYEIENYTYSGRAHVWVRIPSLLSTGKTISVYYKNNTGVSSGENSAGVWDSFYISVYHLDHISGNAIDTKGNFNAEEYFDPNSNMDKAGVVGRADYFDGGDYLGTNPEWAADGDHMFCVWINLTTAHDGTILEDGGNTEGHGLGVLSSGKLRYAEQQGGTDYFLDSTGTYDDSQWHYMCGGHNGSEQFLYIDGGLDQSATQGDGDSGANNARIGMGNLQNPVFGVSSPYNLTASLDEIRVSSTDRSADWINMSYQIVANHGSFVTYSSEQSSYTDIDDCGVLDSANTVYKLNQSLDSDSGVCLNITGNNVTVDGHGYSISYAKTGIGNAIHVEGQNSIKLQHIRINQTLTTRITSPAVVFIDSYNNTINNLTLSIAGDDSPDAYNYGINFQNVTNSTITKSDLDMLTTCDYCYAIYLQSSSNDNTIEHTDIYTSGDWYAYGIYLSSSHRNLIYNATILTIDYRGYGVFLSSADNNTINRSWIRATDTDIDGSPLYISNSDNNLIDNCNLSKLTSSQGKVIQLRDTSYDNNITNTNLSGAPAIYYNGNIYRGFLDNLNIYSSANHAIDGASGTAPNVTLTNTHIDYPRTGTSCQPAIDLGEGFDGWQIHNVTINATGNSACGLGLNGADNLNASNLKINVTGAGADSFGIQLQGVQTNNYIYNSEIITARDSSIYGYGVSDNTGDLNLVNTTFGSTCWRQTYLDHAVNTYWYLDIHINDSSGSNINNANVTVVDSDDSQEFTVLTNSSGDIVRQTAQEYTHSGTLLRDYKTHHVINVNATGYHNKSIIVTMDQNKEITITLNSRALPDVELVSPVDSRIYPSTSVLVNITNSSNVDSVWYEWNNTNYTYTGAGVHDFKIEGNHSITAYANNTNGTSSYKIYFNISSSPINVSSCQYLDSPDITYQLNQSFNSTEDYCLIIRAHNVTLEGNNFEIEYAITDSGTAVFSDGYDYITIQNLNINTSYGGRASSPGIQIKNSQYHNLENNSIYVDGYNDPVAHNYAIHLAGVSNSNITNNSIIVVAGCYDCWEITLWSNSDNNTIKDNYLYSNGDQRSYAIYLYQSDNNLMHNNEIRTHGDSGYGHFLYTSDNNIINKSFFYSTDGTAYAARLDTGADNNLIDNCNFSTTVSGTETIYLWSASADNNITNTNITSTGGVGIKMSTDCHRTIMDNVFINASTQWQAIDVSSADNGTLINSDIHFYENSQFEAAIDISSSDGWIINNTNITGTGNFAGGIYFATANNNNLSNVHMITSGSSEAECVRGQGVSTNNNFFHSTLTSTNDIDVFFYSSGTGTFNFYNTTFESASWDTNPTHVINVYWYANPRVVNLTPSDVSGANVTCHESDGTQMFTELTNSTGWITTKILREYTQNDNGAQSYRTPHICNTSATNYFNDSSTYTIDQNKDFNITLTGTNVPRVTILSPEQSRIYPGTTIWVNFSFTNNTNNLWYNWNNTNYTYTVPVVHDFKEEGAHTLYAYANNTNGTSNSTVTFTISFDPINVSACQDLDSPDLIYQLNKSITGTSGNCFVFKANNITFDGKGYSIQYASTGTGRAFYDAGYDYITIKNVRINQTSTTIVGSPAIGITNSKGHNITNLTLSIAGDDSPDAYNYGFQLNNVDDTHISKSSLTMQTTCDYCWSIYLHNNSDNNSIKNNTIRTSGNYARGIYLLNSDNNTIHNANIKTYDYGADGIYLYSSDNNIINSTSIATGSGDNDIDAITFDTGSDNTWINNCNLSVQRSASKALHFYGSSNNCLDTNITNTNITNRPGYGLWVSANTLPAYRISMDNVIIDCYDPTYINQPIYIQYTDNFTIKNSDLSYYDNSGAGGAIELRYSADHIVLENINISVTGNGGVGIYMYSSNNGFRGTNIRINSTGTGDAEAYRTYSGTFTDIYFFNSTFQADNDDEIYFYLSGSGDINLVNTTHTTAVWGGTSTHDLNVFWYMDVYVNDTDGTSLSSANVTAWDSTSSQNFTQLTDGTGWIRSKIIHAYQQDNAGTTYYNNYTINATRGGYYENTTNVNLTTNMNAYIILAPLGGSINLSFEPSHYLPNWDYNITLSGHLNDSNDDPIPDHELNIFVNGTQFYYNSSTGLLENKSGLPKPTTDVNGNYNYYYNTPSHNTNLSIKVNTTQGGVSDEVIKEIQVLYSYINLTLTADPDPVKTLRNITVYGHANDSNGVDITNARIRIFIDNEEVNITEETNQSDWWNYSFNYRIPITLNSGYAPRANTTIVKKLINFSEYGFSTIDPNSIRVINSIGNTAPSRILRWVEENKTAMIQWILQDATMLTKETDYRYELYFDDPGSGHTDISQEMQNDFFLCGGGDGQNNLTYAWSLNNRSLPTTWTQFDPPGVIDWYEKNRAVIGDFNNDGKYDFMWAGDSTAAIKIHLANGSLNEWSYNLSESIYFDVDIWSGVCTADFNEDGWLDLVVNSDYCSVEYYENNGDGTFATAIDKGDCGGDPRNIVCEDFDGDGNIDVMAGESAGGIEFFKGDGTGGFTDMNDIDNSLAYGDNWHGLWAIDNDNDGDLDIIGKANTSASLYFENNGDATFQTGVDIADGYWVDQDVWSAGNTVDVDNDGELDLIGGYWVNTDHRLSVYFGPVNISQQGTMMNYTFSTTGNSGFMDCKAPQPERDINITPASSHDLLIKTDSSGDYNYTFEAPSSAGGITVKVNMSYDFMSTEKSDTVTVEQDYINVSVNLNPSTASPSNNVTVSGHINLSDGIDVANNTINIFVNNSKYYYKTSNGHLVNSTGHEWWNTSWDYRKPIVILENNATDLTDYQVNITINTQSLISSSYMQSDCDDIRFTDENTTELNYWIESGCNSATTIIWVKTNLSASANNTLYMYYGNSDASEGSNGKDTFIVYEHWDGASINTSLWYDNYDASSVLYDDNGNTTLKLLGNQARYSTQSTITEQNLHIRERVRCLGSSGADNDHGFGIVAAQSQMVWEHETSGNKYGAMIGDNLGGQYHKALACCAYTEDEGTKYLLSTYEVIDVRRYEDYVNSTYDGEEQGTSLSGLLSSGYLQFMADHEGADGVLIDWITVSKYTILTPSVTLGEDQGLTKTNSTGDYVYNFTAPSTLGTYEIKVNTTFNTMVGENTAILTVQEAASDTCTAPSSGDWSVNCSDNCTWSTDTIVPGNMTISDSGHLTLSANLTFNTTGQYIIIDNDGCTFEVASGGEIKNKG